MRTNHLRTREVGGGRLCAATWAGCVAFAAAFRTMWRRGDPERAAHDAALRAQRSREERVVASAAASVQRLIGRAERLRDVVPRLTVPNRFAPRMRAVAARLRRAGAPEALYDQAWHTLNACVALDDSARDYAGAVVAGCAHDPFEDVLSNAANWVETRRWPEYRAVVYERLWTLADALEARASALRLQVNHPHVS